MRHPDILRRRRVLPSGRKRITSYYTEPEQREIEIAAAAQGVSLSAFIASAALKEARKTKTPKRAR